MKDQAVETILALDQLKKSLLKEGDVCPYAALEAAMSKNPQADGRGYVMSARRQFERVMGCALGVVENEGIKRLSLREAVNIAPKARKHIQRTAKRSLWVQSTIIDRQGEMKPEEQKTYLTEFSLAGALSHMSKSSSRKKIAAAVENTVRLLPTAETLALFQPKKSGDETVQ